jgi:hypothetical protein
MAKSGRPRARAMAKGLMSSHVRMRALQSVRTIPTAAMRFSRVRGMTQPRVPTVCPSRVECVVHAFEHAARRRDTPLSHT